VIDDALLVEAEDAQSLDEIAAEEPEEMWVDDGLVRPSAVQAVRNLG
jgi:hypothetical protein